MSKKSCTWGSVGKMYTPVRWRLPAKSGEDKDQDTAWWRRGAGPPTQPSGPPMSVLPNSPDILLTPPLKIFILTENRELFLVSKATPPLCRSCLYPLCGRLVSGPEIAWKSQPLLTISSGRKRALKWCSVRIIKSRDLKMGIFWMDSHLEGLRPRILRVRPWMDRVDRGGGGCRGFGGGVPFFLLLPESLFAAAGRFPREVFAGAPRRSFVSVEVGCGLCCSGGCE